MIKVLVVDDRPDVRLSFMFLLEACGYKPAEAATGEDALAYLARNRVDVLLTDLYMPGMDGLALVRLVRQTPPPRPHIIVMSGSDHLGAGASLQAAESLGADVVLRKPVTRDQLIRAIRSMGDRPPTR